MQLHAFGPKERSYFLDVYYCDKLGCCSEKVTSVQMGPKTALSRRPLPRECGSSKSIGFFQLPTAY